MYDARQIANEFIRHSRHANLPITHLHVQKLVYFAHARMLSIHGEPLVEQKFEAWQYGPVVPVLYHALKHCKNDPIQREIVYRAGSTCATRESDLIDQVFRNYSEKDFSELVELTHGEGTPWSQAYNSPSQNTPISNEVIERYHLREWQEEARETIERISKIPEVRKDILEGLAQFERGEFTSIDREELAAQADSRAATSP